MVKNVSLKKMTYITVFSSPPFIADLLLSTSVQRSIGIVDYIQYYCNIIINNSENTVGNKMYYIFFCRDKLLCMFIMYKPFGYDIVSVL